MNRLGVRIGLVWGLVAVLGFLALSNFVPAATREASGLLPDGGLRLGLDLKGGLHWVLGVKLGVAEEHELRVLGQQLQDVAEDEGWSPLAFEVEAGQLRLETAAADADAVRSYLGEGYQLDAVSAQEGSLVYRLSEERTREIRDATMNQVLEVLRRRIDDPIEGIPDSVVTRQGDDQVMVQIPGGEVDRARVGDLLKTTGFLEFKIVQRVAQSQELLEADFPEGLPEGTVVVPQIERDSDRVVSVFLVPETPAITGQYLDDARVGFDRQQRPIVNFQWNTQGGEIFQELTGENIGASLAIILDDRVYSAPTIRSRISMRGQIEGSFTPQEAADLAVVLRAGSLSVPVVIEEERSVGPALGEDSIASGVLASAIALGLVVAFVGVYYRTSGLYASLALAANLLLILGVMSIPPYATLTLPGIAGIVLTVGMAVDANVIIFERIREELRGGKTPRASIATGFQKAFWTIFDANATTFITAIVLHELGSGPIKGFAVTLMIGILTSVFAALVITRLFYAIYPGQRYVESLSI